MIFKSNCIIPDEQDSKIAGAAVQHDKQKRGVIRLKLFSKFDYILHIKWFQADCLKKTMDRKKKKVISLFIIEQFLKWLNELGLSVLMLKTLITFQLTLSYKQLYCLLFSNAVSLLAAQFVDIKKTFWCAQCTTRYDTPTQMKQMNLLWDKTE